MDTTQYLDLFIDESTEHLETVSQQILELERNPEDKTIIEEIFRSAHTLKGMSATMGYTDLASLTHSLENIFDGVRYDKIKVDSNMIDVMFIAVDDLTAMIQDIAAGGTGQRNVEEIVYQLELLERGESVEDNELTPAKSENKSSKQLTELDEFELSILNESEERGYSNYEVKVELSKQCLLKGVRVFMVFDILEKIGEVIKTEPSVNELEEENFDYEFTVILVTKETAEEISSKINKVSEVQEVTILPFSILDYKVAKEESALVVQKNQATEKEEAGKQVQQKPKKVVQNKTIRVNIERLDILMNLFEELLIDRGRLEQISLDLKHNDLQETVERMSRVSGDLQNIILTMRMVPVDQVFSRFPRMIRQLARDLDKKVEVEIIGAQTELDRTVIDEIGDPLVHLIRNAIDHGIETPEVRLKNGKNETGTIKLEAYHSGNHVFIEISEDGAGINKNKVLSKAQEQGIVTEEQGKLLTDRQIFELIMSSGFSTAEAISDVSGRGVGLDVVKNTIEALGGSISIDSELNAGSVFSIQLPLTLSIISALLVELENEKYAIPLSSIIETAIIDKKNIYRAHGKRIIDFRGRVVPLVFLNDIFEVICEEKEEGKFLSIVIVKKGDKIAGLVVDSFIGQQEVVLKSLGDYLTNIFAISGATILGNGEVALIIDSNALIK